MLGKFKFEGDGGKFFSLLFVQGLLSFITFGIYSPWAMVKIINYLTECLTLDGKKITFEGDGGEIFSLFLVQYLLIIITGGIYAPWAALKFRKYFTDKTTLDGKHFQFDDSNGCDFWCVLFVQQLLVGITFGIYTPWASINIWNEILRRTSYEGKTFHMEADGGQYFSLMFGQGLLTLITFGVYAPWAYAKIANYLISTVKYGDVSRFEANLVGSELFSLFVIHGGILIVITCGIYYPWYVMKWYTYASSHIELKAA